MSATLNSKLALLLSVHKLLSSETHQALQCKTTLTGAS